MRLSAHADERDQLKSIQADIAAKERAVRQKQQQRASLLNWTLGSDSMAETPTPGDQINANIGPGATNVNVGKNINQNIYQFASARAVDAATLAAAHARPTTAQFLSNSKCNQAML